MSKIEAALLEATGQKPQKKGEDRQKYLLRLALTVNDKLSEDEWDALEAAEKGAQSWVVAAIKADNAGKEIEDFPDLEDVTDEPDAPDATEEDDQGPGEEQEEDEEVKTPKKPAKAGAAKSAKPAKSGETKAAAAPPSKKSGGAAKAAKSSGAPKQISMRRALKQMVVKTPKKTVDDLIAALEQKGYDKPSKVTVTTIRADTRDTMKVLVEAGKLQLEL